MSQPSATLGRRARLALVLGALGFSGLLAIARGLEPDPKGFGTHERLGLPPCPFQVRTGAKCPTCGLTTALAWMTRGRVVEAWRAHPGGLLLAPAFGMLTPWMLVSAILGRPWGGRVWTRDGPMIGLVVVATWALCLLAWTLRWLLEEKGGS